MDFFPQLRRGLYCWQLHAGAPARSILIYSLILLFCTRYFLAIIAMDNIYVCSPATKKQTTKKPLFLEIFWLNKISQINIILRKITMIRFTTILALLAIALPSFAQPLHVTDAWIKNLPPAVPMRAGYMQLMNHNDTVATIISISSDAFKKVEIHKTVNKLGVMSMHPIKNIVLEPNGMAALEPGGMHLMLMKPTRSLKIGEEVEVKLQFDNDTSQTILMTVKK
ncbi:MAG: copper(I)-binding protein [Urechidicola sp.]|jgi:copper(I)-binding protein